MGSASLAFSRNRSSYWRSSGRAEIDTRVRLNGSQRLLAVAQLSDGSYWSGGVEVVVTESACLDDS